VANNKSRVSRENLTRRTILVTIVALSTGGSGCDIVQGYQSAGDTLFPEQGTHLASPGLRLVRGHYSQLGVVAGSENVARRSSRTSKKT
jgi:hypothetical protein